MCPFTGNEIAWRKALDPSADALDHADKFMPDDHWYRDRLLRPGIPVVAPIDLRFPDSRKMGKGKKAML